MPNDRPRKSTLSLARAGAELLVAFLFLVLAAETNAHRTFSDDPRYMLLMTFLALQIGTLGLLPALHHASPRMGRIGSLSWLASLALLLAVGALTKP
jgi:hypothetical protein